MFLKMGDQQDKRNWYIYFAVLSTTLIVVVTGSCFTWTSPIIPKLSSTNHHVNPIGKPLTLSESAWIVSSMSLGLIFGPSLSMTLSKFFCKKSILLLVGLPLVLAQIICLFSSTVQYFLIARFLMGVAAGAVWSVLPNYIAEIAEDSNRGFLGTLAGVMSTGGSLIPYIIGPYVSIKTFTIISLLPMGLYYILFGWFVPDSPYDLILKHQERKAGQSLMKFRGTTKIEKELDYISSTIHSSNNDEGFGYLFRNEGLRRALLICVILMVFQQFSGIQAVGSYTQTIFELAGSELSSEICAMIVGTVSLISVLISSRLIDTMGRKILITVSFIVTALSLFSLAVYFYMLSAKMDVSPVSWLPMIGVIIYMFAFNFGLGILPWVILGELFPSNVKAVASTITSLANFCLSFNVTACFPYMVEAIGMSGTFFTFGVVMVLGTVFSLIFVPETKGKSLMEIEKMLKC
ncbi:facilitated trehalose transporter Tret1-like [Sitophilus oryzae]|uniref:Facilitated trehalose transporter Tret1-like n=1 Tax=Sitophilus oryzae TaxID=7048 RepID=A0A6J2YA97_SITOR|nr:facilitated trehalose transporter Tret1-like [Sitophilus oryzae]